MFDFAVREIPTVGTESRVLIPTISFVRFTDSIPLWILIPSHEWLGYFHAPLRGLDGARFISEVLGKKAGLISKDQLAGSLRGAGETRPPVMRLGAS